MRAFEITDLKDFTGKLFLGTLFDDFYLKEASFTTYATFTIDGFLQKNFYDTEEQKDLESSGQTLASWNTLKSIAFQIIRGKRSPLQFHMVLALSPEACEKFFDSSFSTEQASYYINLQFRSGKLLCTTGMSIRTFAPGLHMNSSWDDAVSTFFKKGQISFTNPG
ncbi:MAG: DUF5721 family protein [Eubacteriales bacterium]|nr:DUF5721 family protein [Eubacteriales bacterium]